MALAPFAPSNYDSEYTLFIFLMALNRLKLGRAVTFLKYLAGVVSLIYLPKILISINIIIFLCLVSWEKNRASLERKCNS